MLVGASLETGLTRVGLAIKPKRRPPVPVADSYPDAWGGDERETDGLAMLNLPSRPGTWVIRALLRDEASAPLRVRLHTGAAFEDPAVAAFIEAQRARPRAPLVDPAPGAPLPSYRPEGAPAAPAAPGIVLEGARVAVLRPELPALLRGSLRVEPLASEVLAPDDPREDDPRPHAVVSVTLVVATSKEPRPLAPTLHVPVRLDPAGGCVGHFAVDLFDLGLPREAQTAWVSAVRRDLFVGPAPMAWVSPDRLQ